MTFMQELSSWTIPTALNVSNVPEVGSKAPSSSQLPIPTQDGKATVITFLRHFAEKTFQELRKAAEKHPETNFVAVSHSDQASTDKWIASVGGKLNVRVVVDVERNLYAQWGLGVSSAWHVLNPWFIFAVWQLGRSDNIWNRPTESGSRWQTSGSFAANADGIVQWGGDADSADTIPDFNEALRALGATA